MKIGKIFLTLGFGLMIFVTANAQLSHMPIAKMERTYGTYTSGVILYKDGVVEDFDGQHLATLPVETQTKVLSAIRLIVVPHRDVEMPELATAQTVSPPRPCEPRYTYEYFIFSDNKQVSFFRKQVCGAGADGTPDYMKVSHAVYQISLLLHSLYPLGDAVRVLQR